MNNNEKIENYSSLLDQYPATKIINELNLKPKTK